MAADRIGRRIKRARERKRMTQAQLADAIGVTQKTIDNWEHDKRYPKSSIGALEHVLEVSLDDESPPPALSHAARAALRRDLGDDAERVIRYAEQIASERPELAEPPEQERGLGS